MALSIDEQRLETLRRYEILDTFPEVAFERITRLTANIFGTPIALISLIDEHRQWFKSTHGIDATETPLHVSFCKHAIQQRDVFVIPDATKDDRFCKNEFVTGDPGIRFYAGAPLRSPLGSQIGTLCVVDKLPRRPLRLTEEQMLEDLAAIVIDQLELRLALRKAGRQDPTALPNTTPIINGREVSQ